MHSSGINVYNYRPLHMATFVCQASMLLHRSPYNEVLYGEMFACFTGHVYMLFILAMKSCFIKP